MSNYAKSDWQMTVTLHSSDSLFLYTSFCGVLVRHHKEKSYICINGGPKKNKRVRGKEVL